MKDIIVTVLSKRVQLPVWLISSIGIAFSILSFIQYQNWKSNIAEQAKKEVILKVIDQGNKKIETLEQTNKILNDSVAIYRTKAQKASEFDKIITNVANMPISKQIEYLRAKYPTSFE